jgi:tetraacyldisaccharide 4'-kinase
VRPSDLLRPLTPIYAAVVRARAQLYRRGWIRRSHASVPVVSVGNLTFGGTGKTPTTVALVRDLVRRGHRPAIVTRGYGRRDRSPRVVVGPSPQATPERVGAEPLAIALRLPGVPVVVDADRARGARQAVARGADVLVLDDGFQHLALARDLDVVLLDAGDPFGGDRLPPRGRLREPMSALRRADAVVVTKLAPDDRDTLDAIRSRVDGIVDGVPVLGASLEISRVRTPDGSHGPDWLQDRRVVAVAGVGRPAGFVDTLRGAGARVMETRWFPDHHAYRPDDLGWMADAGRRHEAVVVTTAKDAVKMPADAAWVVEVEMTPHDGSWDRLWDLVPELAS